MIHENVVICSIYFEESVSFYPLCYFLGCSDIRYVQKNGYAISGENDVPLSGITSGEDCYERCSDDATCKSADFDHSGAQQ